MLSRKISIAPMMAYTDRHYRVLMRLITRHTLLYTEMITTGSLIHGDRRDSLAFSSQEHPLALQLGGSNPQELATCARMAEEFGYDEVNLNVGCPSDRVLSGEFGACLMKKPDLVAEGVAAMSAAVKIPVTVKTRIGVDQQDSYAELQHFIRTVAASGCQTFIIHARKAWLKGLSPRQNRSVPPLRYDVVYQLKQDFPQLEIIINGGINTIAEAEQHCQQVDGVMIGREAYSNPFLFATVDKLFFNDHADINNEPSVVVENYLPYIAEQLKQGVPFWKMSRHLMGLFQGKAGAKEWRRHLSTCRQEPKTLEELEMAFRPYLSQFSSSRPQVYEHNAV